MTGQPGGWPAGTVRRAETQGPASLLALAKAARGPVIELAGSQGERGQFNITFVCAGRPGGHVWLFCPALPGGFAALAELGDGVFRLSCQLPAGLRVPYHFRVDPPQVRDDEALRALARSPAGRQIDRLNPSFDQLSVPSLRLRSVDSVLTLPGALPSPPARPRPGVATGRLDEFVIVSQALGRRKEVLVYHPAGRQDSALPLVLLLQGGQEWEQRAFLDNLVAALPAAPFRAVLFRERSYLAKLRDFGQGAAHARFVAAELLPALRARGLAAQEFGAVAGFSAGGLAAAGLAAAEPGLFPRLAVISGALHLGPRPDVRQEHQPGPGPLLSRFAQAPAVPRLAYLAAGQYEDAWDHSITESTAALARLLRERGSLVRHEIRPTGHDSMTARAHLADGLAWLLAG